MSRRSLVLELQRLAQDTTPITELLRRCKVVAVKLNQRGTLEWIASETDGYPPKSQLPEYRVVPCTLRFLNPWRGWLPVNWTTEDELQAAFSSQHIRQSIATLEPMATGSGSITIPLNPQEIGILLMTGNDFAERLTGARFISRESIIHILECVRSKILDWSLELERNGVLGYDMTFSSEERQGAGGVTIHGSVGTLVQGDLASNSSIAHSPNATAVVAGASLADGGSISATLGDGSSPRLEQAIANLMSLNAELANGFKALANAIKSDRVLDATARTESVDQLVTLAEESAKPPSERQSKGVLKAIAGGVRETLGLSADLLQLYATFFPTLAAMLAIAT